MPEWDEQIFSVVHIRTEIKSDFSFLSKISMYQMSEVHWSNIAVQVFI